MQSARAGSGKKYKKCHGLQSVTEPSSRHKQSSFGNLPVPDNKATQPPISIAIKYWERSLPGQQLSLVSIPQYAERIAEQVPDNPCGSSGLYEAVFILHRPGQPLDPEYNALANELLEGNSHFRVGTSKTLTIFSSAAGCSLFDESRCTRE